MVSFSTAEEGSLLLYYLSRHYSKGIFASAPAISGSSSLASLSMFSSALVAARIKCDKALVNSLPIKKRFAFVQLPPRVASSHSLLPAARINVITASAGVTGAVNAVYNASTKGSCARSFFSQRSAGLKIPRYQRIYGMTAKELRHAVADAARRQLRMHDLWDAFLYRACVLRSELSPEQIASIIQSLAAVEKPLISFIDFILEDMRHRSLHRLRLQDASVLLAALSRLKGARDPLLLHALLPVLIKRLHPPALPESLSTDKHNNNSTSISADNHSRTRTPVTKNSLSLLKHIALLAHAYVKLKGPQTEVLLSCIATRLAAPGMPLLLQLPSMQNKNSRGWPLGLSHPKNFLVHLYSSNISSTAKKIYEAKNDSPTLKKRSKLRVQQSIALLLGAYSTHARTVCERAKNAATPVVSVSARVPGDTEGVAASRTIHQALNNATDQDFLFGEGKDQVVKKPASLPQSIPFAAVIETLLEHGILLLPDFSPRDCACFLKALEDILACDATNTTTSTMYTSDSLLTTKNSTINNNLCNIAQHKPNTQDTSLTKDREHLQQQEGLLLLGGIAGLRGILEAVHRRLVKLRFELKGSECITMLTSVWPLEQHVAATPTISLWPSTSSPSGKDDLAGESRLNTADDGASDVVSTTSTPKRYVNDVETNASKNALHKRQWSSTPRCTTESNYARDRISQLLLEELVYRAADLPAAAVLDAIRMLINNRRQAALLTATTEGSNKEVYPALEAVLLCRLASLMPSLFPACPNSADSAMRRPPVLVTPAAVAELVRQLCVPRMQPFLPPSFVPHAATCRLPFSSRQCSAKQRNAAEVAGHFCYDPIQTTAPKKCSTAGMSSTGLSASQTLTSLVRMEKQAESSFSTSLEDSAATTHTSRGTPHPTALTAVAEAVIAAEEAAAVAEAEAIQRLGRQTSLSENVEPVYCLSRAAGTCMQRLLSALAASANVKRLLNLQTAASLCWTCAALRVRDPLLGRLLLQHRGSLFLSLAAIKAANSAEASQAADGNGGNKEAVISFHGEENRSITKETAWKKAAGETENTQRTAGTTETLLETQKVGRQAVEPHQKIAFATREMVAAVAASCKGTPVETTAGVQFSLGTEKRGDAAQRANVPESTESATERRESGVETSRDSVPLWCSTIDEVTEGAPGTTPLADPSRGIKEKTKSWATLLATLAAGLAHLGMYDVADALGIFPLLSTIENYADVETALTALMAAAVFALTRRPRTLAATLLSPAANTVYQQMLLIRTMSVTRGFSEMLSLLTCSLNTRRTTPLHVYTFSSLQRAVLLPAHYASLTFIANSSMPEAFHSSVRDFFRHAWRLLSPLHPLLRPSKVNTTVRVDRKRALEASLLALDEGDRVIGSVEKDYYSNGEAAVTKRAPRHGTRAPAGTQEQAAHFCAHRHSSAASVSPRVFAALVQSAPHRSRVSMADILQAVFSRAESHRNSERNSTTITTSTADVSVRGIYTPWIDGLLRMRAENLAEQILYHPSHTSSEDRILPGKISRQAPSPLEMAAWGAAMGVAAAAKKSSAQPLVKSTFADDVEHLSGAMLLREGDAIATLVSHSSDETGAHKTSADDAAAATDEEIHRSSANGHQKSRACRALPSFPERVRLHFKKAWKEIRLHSEVFIPTCSRCLPFAVELNSLSNYVAALADAGPIPALANRNATADVCETRNVFTTAGPPESRDEFRADAQAAGAHTIRGFVAAQDFACSAPLYRGDNAASHACVDSADHRVERLVYKGRTTGKDGTAYMSGSAAKSKKQNFHRAARKINVASSRCEDEDYAPISGSKSSGEDSEVRKREPEQQEGDEEIRGDSRLYNGTLRSMRRQQRHNCVRIRIFGEERQRTREGVRAGEDRSADAIRNQRRAATRRCRSESSEQRSRSSSCGKKCRTRRTGRFESVPLITDGFENSAWINLSHLDISEHEFKDEAAWATLDGAVIRKETHALIELLWSDFDFMWGAWESGAGETALDHRKDTNYIPRTLSAPRLCPGRAAELSALKRNGWAVFCISETTWRGIENINMKGTADEDKLHRDLKLYVMQCIAGLKSNKGF